MQLYTTPRYANVLLQYNSFDTVKQKFYTTFMKKRKTGRLTRKKLVSLGIPAMLIPGILFAVAFGWKPTMLTKTNDYHTLQTIFPKSGIAKEVYDGDTFRMQSGVQVRLIGVNAPNKGERQYVQAKEYLGKLIANTRVYLEYDRYQDDKYGRVLAWVWVGCEKEPEFFPADYMHVSNNASREGLAENPTGCAGGTLVNEAMVRAELADSELYKDRGELKYEKRIRRVMH